MYAGGLYWGLPSIRYRKTNLVNHPGSCLKLIIMSERKPCASQDLPETFFVCCLCSPDVHLDNSSTALYNVECPTHGRTWHRKMVRLADGSVTLVHHLTGAAALPNAAKGN